MKTRDYPDLCPMCKGERRIIHPAGHPIQCPVCRGSGTITIIEHQPKTDPPTEGK